MPAAERAGPFSCSTQLNIKFQLLLKTKMLKKTTHSYLVDNRGLSIKQLLYLLVLS